MWHAHPRQFAPHTATPTNTNTNINTLPKWPHSAWKTQLKDNLGFLDDYMRAVFITTKSRQIDLVVYVYGHINVH